LKSRFEDFSKSASSLSGAISSVYWFDYFILEVLFNNIYIQVFGIKRIMVETLIFLQKWDSIHDDP